jgi:hypothetical protein
MTPVVEDEPVTVRGEHERNLQRLGVIERLLNTVADAAAIVLGLDDRKGNVRLVIEDVIGPLGFATGHHPAADDHAPLREGDFLAKLGLLVPAGAPQGRRDELRADVPLTELLLVHAAIPIRNHGTRSTVAPSDRRRSTSDA